ncbi:MAG: aspartate aminotransferase [Candidatus Marinimicrobia bacterium]|nr:aspartate aminotransferase [Candidatus Neomarinimicrobiota bacterium]|tara:strand:- start:570 stop:1769 length:1200 start_codon:yes stop_codon:yes gene_type:complete
MTLLANRVEQIKPSFTLDMVTRAAELKAQGIDVINFSAGQPDFNTPDNIIKVAKQAMDKGETKYTAGAGTLELREAVCTKVKRENNLIISPDRVLISNGEKQSLSLACQALFQKGDEVIIFKPYWVSFPEFVTLADATPVFVNTNRNKNFEPDENKIKTKLSGNIKGIIVNSPSNPTGVIWSEKILVKILKLAKRNKLVIISDECYERLVFDKNFISIEKLNQDHNIGANVLTCMSLSKTYSMTGWRIGYSFGDKAIIDGMAKIQSQATSCANSISQAAGVEALLGDQSMVSIMIKKFKERRDLIVFLLNEINGVNCELPGGAFYAFPNFDNYLGKSFKGKKIENSFDLSNLFLDIAKVVTVPGDGFGAPGHIRFSYPVSKKLISDGIDRVKIILEQLN